FEAGLRRVADGVGNDDVAGGSPARELRGGRAAQAVGAQRLPGTAGGLLVLGHRAAVGNDVGSRRRTVGTGAPPGLNLVGSGGDAARPLGRIADGRGALVAVVGAVLVRGRGGGRPARAGREVGAGV